MVPSSLVPDIGSLSIDPSIMIFLSVVTFTAHLILMNVVLGGSIILFVQGFTGEKSGINILSSKLPTILALAINAGVPALLFLQSVYGAFIYTSSILMAVYWLAVTAVLMIAYYGLYFHYYKKDKISQTAGQWVLLAVVCLLLYVAFMFTNNMTMMLRVDTWSGFLQNPYGRLLNASDATFAPRFLHMVCSAVAIGGLSIAWFGRYKQDQDAISSGMKWFVRATMLNFILGFWFLLSLPDCIIPFFMGHDPVATWVLMVSSAFGLLMIVSGVKKQVVFSSLLAVITVFMMAVLRHILRSIYLSPYYDMSEVVVRGEYLPFGIFIFSALIGTICIYYMVRLYLKAVRS